MDVLNEHLAQLKLMNSRPLSPKSVDLASTSSSSSTGNSGGSSINNSGAVTSGNVVNSGGVIHKNTGPAVPPKPMKKNPTQIPYNNNNIIRQTCEPIYSTKNLHKNDILQSNAAVISKVPILPSSSSITSTLPTASISHSAKLQQNQNLSRSSNKQSHYSNMEMTLDNPAILNHQLEALEHHKKQLEMKGMLPSSTSSTLSSSSGNKYSTNNVKLAMEKFQEINDATNTIDSPSKIHVYSNTSILKSKLPSSLSLPSSSPSSAATPTSSSASSSASSSGLNLKKNSDIVYSNILHQQNNTSSSGVIHHPPPPPPSSSSVSSYVPVSVSPAPPHQVYSNINYNSGVGELPPPPPLELPGSNINLNNPHSSFSLDYTHQINEDDLPPPPSPVSSSYSELRRATDNFPQMPVYPLPSVYDNGGSSISSGIDPLSGGTDQQTYVNTSFQNDYSTYGPISQASSSPNSDCYGYGSLSKDSSTYESIYEPINPRPPSQLSSRSNYSLYTSYVNGIQSGSPGTPLGTTGKSIGGSNIVNGSGNSVGGRLSTNKEAEVETLTDLLVHSMDAGCDVDSFGVCVKCGERVVGENSGCTAMEQIYHIACFTCAVCQINLQGKPFYALDGKPHCEEDYLNTLEKCSVCMKPILERILRATGKPYHPGCFTCIVCGNSLDGIPFTVDATNQNYCIEDFHKKFAPRCCVCKQPIMPEPGQEETVRVVALDRSFHFECYKCEDCGLLLSSEAEGRGCYPLDDHVLCKSCNAKRVQALTNCMTTEL